MYMWISSEDTRVPSAIYPALRVYVYRFWQAWTDVTNLFAVNQLRPLELYDFSA